MTKSSQDSALRDIQDEGEARTQLERLEQPEAGRPAGRLARLG